MPIREYQVCESDRGCDRCRQPFERLESLSAPVLERCPVCGAPVSRLLSAPRVGASRTSFDQRAKNAGFRKLQKISRGEYEVKY